MTSWGSWEEAQYSQNDIELLQLNAWPRTCAVELGSVIVTLLALFLFGFVKGRFTTHRPLRSAWQTVLVGGLAASAAFVIAKLIG